MTSADAHPPPARTELIADTAIALLAERGLRGLTHRAVDEAAGLPQGSTSNFARTRPALLETAVRRLAEREAQVISTGEMPSGEGGVEELADGMALAVHRYLTHHPRCSSPATSSRWRRPAAPELRAMYVQTGTSTFREPLTAMLRQAGSKAPERHAHSLIAWCDGMLFSCTAGSYAAQVPGLEELRAALRELLRGMLSAAPERMGRSHARTGR